MLQVKYTTINSEFIYPFTISKGTKTHQPALIVSISFNGRTGYGEAPAIIYYNITVDKMVEDLETKLSIIEKYSFTEPDRFWHFCSHLFPENYFLVCALDMAYWDLYGKTYNKPLSILANKVNNITTQNNIPTDYTIGIANEETMVAKMQDNPWPIYKIKCGFDGDVEIIAAMRKHTQAIFRVDANAGWPNAAIALQKIIALQNLGVEIVEQPLAKDDWDGMNILYQQSPLPLFADEACVFETDVEKCPHHFHGINIKLTKCGGITPALRMIKTARKLNLKIMIGCMNETSIGSAAMAQLRNQIDYLDMDGPLLLKTDTATGIQYNKDGTIQMNDNAAGLGVEVIGMNLNI